MVVPNCGMENLCTPVPLSQGVSSSSGDKQEQLALERQRGLLSPSSQVLEDSIFEDEFVVQNVSTVRMNKKGDE